MSPCSEILQVFFRLKQQLLIEHQTSGRTSTPLCMVTNKDVHCLFSFRILYPAPSSIEVQLIEAIRSMTEQLIWGDQHHDESFFS